MTHDEFFIHDDGTRLHAKLDRPEGFEHGSLAIVLHGLTGHMEERHIMRIARALNDVGVATLRVELCGHGKSDGAFVDHTLYKWVSNTLAVVDYAQGLGFADRLYLGGHSQGGLTAMLVAGMRPDDIAALLLLSPGVSLVTGAREGSILGARFDPRHVPNEIVIPGIAPLNGNYVRVAQAINMDEVCYRYTGPVLLVHGEADGAVPLAQALDVAAHYRDPSIVVLPGDDHCYNAHLDMAVDGVRTFVVSLGHTSQPRAM